MPFGEFVERQNDLEAGRLATLARQKAEKDKLLATLDEAVTIGVPYVDPERIRSPEFRKKELMWMMPLSRFMANGNASSKEIS